MEVCELLDLVKLSITCQHEIQTLNNDDDDVQWAQTIQLQQYWQYH